MKLHQLWMLYGELHCDLASQDFSLKCYYDQNLMSSLSQIKNAFFSAYQKWLYKFRSLKWSLAPSMWKYWTSKCRFFASAITNLCSSEPMVWSYGLTIQSYCSLTCDVIFWTRWVNQTWTVRNRRAILEASLVFARFWECKPSIAMTL